MAVAITISGQYGGPDAGTARATVQRVKDVLREPVAVSQRHDLRMRFRLHVSGAVTQFDGPSGLVGVRVFAARGEATCDVTLGPEVWSAGERAVVEVLRSSLGGAVVEVVRRLRATGVVLDADAVVREVDERLAPLLRAV